MDRFITGPREVLKYEICCQPHLHPISPYVYQVDNRQGPSHVPRCIIKASDREYYVCKPTGYSPLSPISSGLSSSWHSIRLILFSTAQNDCLSFEVTRNGRQDLKYSVSFQSLSRLLPPRGKGGVSKRLSMSICRYYELLNYSSIVDVHNI
jgi:hypothetical protein